MPQNPTPVFQPLTGLYEPSAIVQLADGRFLVVEDEKEHPFSLVSITAEGRVSTTSLAPGWLESGDGFWKLDDLEGLTLDHVGQIYAITSQSLDGDGDVKKSREKLVRFRIQGERVVEAKSFKGLKRALVESHPVLAGAASIRNVKSGGGLNIEALEISGDGQHLWVGLRSPLHDDRAILVRIENPSGIFDRDEPPRVSARLETLDLGGSGIRGLSYLASLDGYLVISGPVGRAPVQFQLWLWSGQPGAPAQRVRIPGLPDIEHAEGICPTVIGGQARIVLVSDDGSRAEGRFARYVVLDPGQLRIEP